jgi:hypothetical protein
MSTRTTQSNQAPTQTGTGKKRKRNRNRNRNRGGGASPYGPKANKSPFSFTEAVAGAIHGGASSKAKFWIWVTIAAILLFLNAKFYVWLLSTKFAVSIIAATVFGILISVVTTVFEAGPGIRKKSSRSALEKMFLAAAKPSQLPTITQRQTKDPNAIYDNYAGTEKRNDDDDDSVRWILIAFESIVGIIFLGTVGTGIQALGAIVMFVLSIFGAEHSIVKAVRVHESVLPPAVAAQLKKVWRNADRPLDLK